LNPIAPGRKWQEFEPKPAFPKQRQNPLTPNARRLKSAVSQFCSIILIGVTASETNSAVNGGRALPIAPVITSAVRLYNGVFVLTFTNLSGTNFTVIGSTNPGAPASNWISLGAPFQASGDFYEFIDNSASNRATFFYQLRFP